jgi:hypothetical protein
MPDRLVRNSPLKPADNPPSKDTPARAVSAIAAGVRVLAVAALTPQRRPGAAGRRGASDATTGQEEAFAAALPPDGLDAWPIYLRLPICGDRLPARGWEATMRLS